MKSLILTLLTALLLLSCRKDPVQGPQGPPGPQGAGILSQPGIYLGKLRVYNQYNNPYTTGLNSATISIAGTNIQTVPDAAGNYTLAGVPEGSHEFSLSRPGSRTMKMDQMHMIPNGRMYMTFYMSDTANFVFQSGQVKDTLVSGTPFLKIRLFYTPDQKSRQGLVIFSATPDISPDKPASYAFGYGFTLQASSSDYLDGRPLQLLPFVNFFKSGDLIYARIYPNGSYYGNSYNYLENKETYHATGTPLPATYTLTMP